MQMLAADCFSAFQEKGLNNGEQVKAMGNLFRDTFLTTGGSVKGKELFRRFRGRDPCPDSLLTLYGIQKENNNHLEQLATEPRATANKTA